MRSFIICILQYILLGSNQGGDEWRHVTCMGAIRNAYKILVTKSEGKRLLRKPRYRWEDNVIVNLTEIGWGDMDWINLTLDRD
jgi:hypothetical protein